MAYHSSETTGSVHIPYNWSYANSGERTSATGFTSGDIGKLARQTDDNTLWMLVATAPTWVAVTGEGGEGTQAGSLIVDAVKSTAGTLTPGQVVRLTGWSETYGCVEVELAKADSVSTMPACGFVQTTVTGTSAGTITVSGHLINVDTSGVAEAACLWVSAATAGAFTSTRPTTVGHYVQIVGACAKSDASTGVIRVSPHPPASYMQPNIAENKYWVGNATNQATAQWIKDSYHNSSDGEETTTGTDYVQKVRLTFTPVAAGDYEIHFSLMIATSNTGVGMKTRVQVDDTTTKKEINGNLISGYPAYFERSGHFVVNLTAAAHNIDLDYASSSSGKTLYIKEAVLTARRIGQS